MAILGTRASTDRQQLRNIIPLDTPLKISLFLGDVCNLKCRYCLHSVADQKLDLTRNLMSMETFDLIVKELNTFPQKIKMVLIAGLGEPLIHPELPSMIECLKRNNVCEKITLVTNGLLLNHELGLRILNAGVDRIEISIQGVSAEDYEKNARVKIDFLKFYDELTFLYNNRGLTQVYIQSLDSNFSSEEKRVKFMKLFGPISDILNIAPTLRLDDEVDYSFLDNIEETSLVPNEEKVVCPQIFYQVHFLSDGTVMPCCHALRGKKLAYGNIYKEHIIDIWNGAVRKKLLVNQLRYGKVVMPACKTCMSPNQCVESTDNLDDCRESLLKKIGV